MTGIKLMTDIMRNLTDLFRAPGSSYGGLRFPPRSTAPPAIPLGPVSSLVP